MAIVFKSEKERIAFLRSKFEEIPIKAVEDKEVKVKSKKKVAKKKNDEELSK